MSIAQVLTIVSFTIVKVSAAYSYAEPASHRRFGSPGVRAPMLPAIAPHNPPSSAPIEVKSPSCAYQQQSGYPRWNETRNIV